MGTLWNLGYSQIYLGRSFILMSSIAKRCVSVTVQLNSVVTDYTVQATLALRRET